MITELEKNKEIFGYLLLFSLVVLYYSAIIASFFGVLLSTIIATLSSTVFVSTISDLLLIYEAKKEKIKEKEIVNLILKSANKAIQQGKLLLYILTFLWVISLLFFKPLDYIEILALSILSAYVIGHLLYAYEILSKFENE